MVLKSRPPVDNFDDDDYPAYTMGRAAEMIGATPGFLRAIGELGLITPLRSEGGHRRYSRYQLRIAESLTLKPQGFELLPRRR